MVIVAFFLTCNLEEQVVSPEYSDSENADQQSLNKAFTYTNVWKNDVDGEEEWNPCANGGEGEEMDLTGSWHGVFHTTDDGNGGFHYTIHFTPQNVFGVGRITGDIYKATGAENFQGNIKVGNEATESGSWRWIGKGSAVNFHEYWTWHVTVNANGETTVWVEKENIVCK